MRAAGGWTLLLCGLTLAGCPSPEIPDPPAQEDADGPPGETDGRADDPVAHEELVSSMAVRVDEDEVRLALHVTNHGPEPIELEFPTSQRFDFSVHDAEGEEVWRWSEEMAFAQVLGTERIAAGESVTFEATWDPGTRAGDFEARGRLTATNRPVERRASFSLPGE